ncbi:MAG: hypothetical protein DRH12_14715 [Deltaproteobacteria bacterium]|nr:MAG: hypothetical protein DRH12_14715 [Deltaproteobacteria bacterium]
MLEIRRELLMSGELYQMLWNQLDKYSVGQLKIKSGIGMKILQKLFPQEQAKYVFQPHHAP